MKKTLEERLQAQFEKVVRPKNRVFGSVIALETAGREVSWSYASGHADAALQRPVTPHSPIYIASITKVYVAVATLLLEEQGRLSLSDKISRFLSKELIAGLHILYGVDRSAEITIHHLLSQTTGLPDYFEGEPKRERSLLTKLLEDGDCSWDVAEAVRISRAMKPGFTPGEREGPGQKADYSDTNFQLLGAVIESVTGQPLQETLDELIFSPLHVTSTYMAGSARENSERPAIFYNGAKPLEIDNAMRSFGPDGGLVSTVDELLIFARAVFEARLFKDPSTVDRMQQWNRIFFPMRYGLGLMRFKLPRIFSPFLPAPELLGHSGSTGSFLYYAPGPGIYIAGTLNQMEKQNRPFRLMLKLIRTVEKGR